MSRKKTERQLNLVICLLDTKRYLTVQEIRETVPGYDSDSEDAFRRMFERDKDELRELGIPLETGGEGDAGYRIARRDYELPEITLDAEEAAAVGLAARLWQSAPLSGATGTALLKLRAAGVDPEPESVALEPRIEAAEPGFEECWRATREGRALRFDYRGIRNAEPQTREVEPWGIVNWHGRWYLVGHDRGRDAERVFRLSRIVGDVTVEGEAGSVVVPADLDLRATVTRLAERPTTGTARVRVRAGTCAALRHTASAVVPGADGWDVLELAYFDARRLAGQVCQYGPDALVLEPAELREAVRANLRAVVGASETAAR